MSTQGPIQAQVSQTGPVSQIEKPAPDVWQRVNHIFAIAGVIVMILVGAVSWLVNRAVAESAAAATGTGLERRVEKIEDGLDSVRREQVEEKTDIKWIRGFLEERKNK